MGPTNAHLQHSRARARWAVTLSASLLFGAAAMHFIMVTVHMQEARAQGLFFVVLAVAQVVLGVLVLRHLDTKVAYAGILVSGASILLYILAVTVRPPFGDDADNPDLVGYSTKLLEVLTIVALVYLLLWRIKAMPSPPKRARLQIVAAVVGGLVLGGAIYGIGIAVEPLFPWLKEGESHNMGHGGAEGGTGNGTMGGMKMLMPERAAAG